MRIIPTRLILFVLAGVFAAQLFFYYPNLGDSIATHYDELGRPNNILPKGVFLVLEFALLVLIVGEALIIPALVERIPPRSLNIPNRDYWLADERRESTYGFIRQSFGALGVVLVAFFIVVNQIVLRINVTREPLPVWMLAAVVAVFGIALVVWFARFARRFRRPAETL